MEGIDDGESKGMPFACCMTWCDANLMTFSSWTDRWWNIWSRAREAPRRPGCHHLKHGANQVQVRQGVCGFCVDVCCACEFYQGRGNGFGGGMWEQHITDWSEQWHYVVTGQVDRQQEKVGRERFWERRDQWCTSSLLMERVGFLLELSRCWTQGMFLSNKSWSLGTSLQEW